MKTKENNPPKSFTVKRSSWFRGKGGSDSYLLKSNGRKCCIGFVGQQCGILSEDLLNISSVEECSEDYEWPEFLKDHIIASEAYDINDDENIADKERETELKAFFRKHGYTIKFVD